MQWQVFLTAGGQDVRKIKNSVAKRLRMNKYYGTEKNKVGLFLKFKAQISKYVRPISKYLRHIFCSKRDFGFQAVTQARFLP